MLLLLLVLVLLRWGYLECGLVVEALGTHTLTQRTHALHIYIDTDRETPSETRGMVCVVGPVGGVVTSSCTSVAVVSPNRAAATLTHKGTDTPQTRSAPDSPE